MFKKSKKIKVIIDGMNCIHCVNKIKNTLEEDKNIKKVNINLNKKEAIITGNDNIDKKLIKNKIESLNYKVVSIGEK